MPDPTTIPAALVPGIIREGCALVLTRDTIGAHGRKWPKGAALTCCGMLGGIVVTELDGLLTPADVAIDLTRQSGQWAAAMYAIDQLDGEGDAEAWDIAWRGITGEADPTELRRVVLAIAGVPHAD